MSAECIIHNDGFLPVIGYIAQGYKPTTLSSLLMQCDVLLKSACLLLLIGKRFLYLLVHPFVVFFSFPPPFFQILNMIGLLFRKYQVTLIFRTPRIIQNKRGYQPFLIFHNKAKTSIIKEIVLIFLQVLLLEVVVKYSILHNRLKNFPTHLVVDEAMIARKSIPVSWINW